MYYRNGKGEVILVPNYAHTWGSRSIAPLSWTMALDGDNQPEDPAPLPRGKDPGTPLHSRLGGTHGLDANRIEPQSSYYAI